MNSSSNKEYVTTLVAGFAPALSQTIVNNAATSIEQAGGTSIRTAWLEQGRAADIFCTGLTAENIRTQLNAALQSQPLDFIVQPAATRRKKLLLADMESTVIEQEMIDELASVIGRHDEVAAITRRAMNGEIDFAGALRERVAMLRGQPASILDRVAKRITFMHGASALVAAMKAQSGTCWLVSGGFTYFAELVAVRLGFDKFYANTLVVRDDMITGEVVNPILDKNTKKALLEKACAELKLSLHETLTVGDGANDIPMLAACNEGGGLGIAFHAKPNVRQATPNQVNHVGLEALIYVQGLSAPQEAA